MGDKAVALSLMKPETLRDHSDDNSLFVHLYHAVKVVTAAKDRMWEVLKEMVSNGDEELLQYGWKEHEYSESFSRMKFNRLWERFQ